MQYFLELAAGKAESRPQPPKKEEDMISLHSRATQIVDDDQLLGLIDRNKRIGVNS